VKAILDAGAQRLLVGHGGYLPRQAVINWLANHAEQPISVIDMA